MDRLSTLSLASWFVYRIDKLKSVNLSVMLQNQYRPPAGSSNLFPSLVASPLIARLVHGLLIEQPCADEVEDVVVAQCGNIVEAKQPR
jgi:hypothetical protein